MALILELGIEIEIEHYTLKVQKIKTFIESQTVKLKSLANLEKPQLIKKDDTENSYGNISEMIKSNDKIKIPKEMVFRKNENKI